MKIQRRLLLKDIFRYSACLSVLQFLLTACKGRNSPLSSGGSGGGDCLGNGAIASIGSDHGHIAPTVSPIDVINAAQKAYNIAAGTAGHTHTVTITSGAFITLQGNNTLTVATDADGTGHSHVVTFDCS